MDVDLDEQEKKVLQFLLRNANTPADDIAGRVRGVGITLVGKLLNNLEKKGLVICSERPNYKDARGMIKYAISGKLPQENLYSLTPKGIKLMKSFT